MSMICLGQQLKTPNAQHRTSNIERRIRAELIYKIATTTDFWNNQGGQ